MAVLSERPRADDVRVICVGNWSFRGHDEKVWVGSFAALVIYDRPMVFAQISLVEPAWKHHSWYAGFIVFELPSRAHAHASAAGAVVVAVAVDRAGLVIPAGPGAAEPGEWAGHVGLYYEAVVLKLWPAILQDHPRSPDW